MLNTTMVRFALLSAVALVGVTIAAEPSGSSSLPTVTKPTTLSNGQSACVQYGDCTSAPRSNTLKTETQYSPITPPPKTSVPHLSNSGQTDSYVSSFAADGASQAYATRSKPSDTTPVPPETTVTSQHKTVINGKTTTQVAVNQDDAGTALLPNMIVVYTLSATAIACVMGTVFL